MVILYIQFYLHLLSFIIFSRLPYILYIYRITNLKADGAQADRVA